MLQWKVLYLFCHLLTENWWSVLEPPLFLKIVELYKDVVVHLLKLYKIGIPPAERRIFTNFLHTAFRVLEILHRVCLCQFKPTALSVRFLSTLCAVQLLKVKQLNSSKYLNLTSTEESVVVCFGPKKYQNSGFQSDMGMELSIFM